MRILAERHRWRAPLLLPQLYSHQQQEFRRRPFFDCSQRPFSSTAAEGLQGDSPSLHRMCSREEQASLLGSGRSFLLRSFHSATVAQLAASEGQVAAHRPPVSSTLVDQTDLTEADERQMHVYEGLQKYVEKKYPDKSEWKELLEQYNPRAPLVEPDIVDLRPPDRPVPPIDRVIIPVEVEEKYRVTRKTKWMIKQLRSPHISDVPSMLEQWVKTMYPKRSDWMDLLKEFQAENDNNLMFQIYEFGFFEDTFEVRSQDIERVVVKYINLGRYEDVERIMGMLDSKGFPPDFVVCTLLLDMYCNLKRLDKAREMYDEIRALGFVPDVAACTELINFYCESGNPEAGEMLLAEIENEKVHGTVDTYLAVLRGYGKSGKTSDAVRIYRAIKDDQFLRPKMGTQVYSALMRAYTQAKMFSSAVLILEDLLLDGLTPEDDSLAFLISSLQQEKNQFSKALDVLLKLESKAVRPGVETLATLIDWFGKLGLVDEAELLFEEIERKVDVPGCKAYVNLYATYARASMLEKARSIFDSIRAKKVVLTDWAFEQMIQSLLDGKELQEAQALRDKMVSHGFTPSDQIERALLGVQTDSLFAPLEGASEEKTVSKEQSPLEEQTSKPSERERVM